MTYLSDELYTTVTNSVPITCVDVLPVRRIDGQWEIGVITRHIGSQVDKTAVLGGRIQHGETIGQAISRHIETDYDISDYKFFDGGNEFQPFRVQ